MGLPKTGYPKQTAKARKGQGKSGLVAEGQRKKEINETEDESREQQIK